MAMPIPNPSDGESHDEFVERCMGNDTMKDDYPDDDQRLAVCQTQWEDSRSAGDIERRIAGSIEVVESRKNGKKQPSKLVGYAALFNKPTELFPGLIERIAPGAFTRTLAEGADVRALVDHDPSKIIGRTKSGTLALQENRRGLKVAIDAADTQAGRDILKSVDRGDVDQMSFGFRVVKESWEEKKDGSVIRTLEDVDLFDVSAVTFPAYADTTIAARSLELRKQGSEKPQPEPTPKMAALKKQRAEASLTKTPDVV
jgi:HK97 family phage prohead protease